MGAVLPAGYRYRHVVFPAAARRPPLNLGAPATATGAASPPEGRQPTDEDTFVSWLFSSAGLSARHYRPASLRRRVPACLRALRVESVPRARLLLQRSPELVPAAIDAMLIGVTGFFRDPPVFAAAFRHLLPAMADRGRVLRVWSAACSDGAELYSVAMLLAELRALRRCELLGTDCRGRAVARAAAGSFDAAACRSVPADLKGQYFLREAGSESGASHRVHPRLRERVTWRAADVLDAPEPGPWDVVLCRNLAMYLKPPAAERLWRGLAGVLRPGGLLVCGKAERPDGVPGLSPVGPCVYLRGAIA